MMTFLTYLATTFALLLFVAVLISFCKRRQSRTRHGLTGMCHRSGGAMCSSCNAKLKITPEKKEKL